jgi:hypothetical protein
MGQMVTTTGDELRIYRARDLTASLIAQVPKGHDVELGVAEVVERGEWIEANFEGHGMGYVLGPNARGNTTLGLIPTRTIKYAPVVPSSASPVKLPMTDEQRVGAGVVIAILLVGVVTTIIKTVDAFRLNGLIYGFGYGFGALAH